MGSPPKIPGGATLVFDVELFDFQGEDISKDKVSTVQISGIRNKYGPSLAQCADSENKKS